MASICITTFEDVRFAWSLQYRTKFLSVADWA